uniref:Snake toxin/toxin-like domain-containing protein n=1 Tax=Amazona collaria TaxID=241587 RepID=A0A8B9ETP5_9PSIT
MENLLLVTRFCRNPYKQAPVLFLSAAQSLRCYTCKEPTDIAKCKTVTLCPPKSIVCSTTLHSVDSGYPFFGNITVTRNCEEECVSNDGIGSNKPKSCCYTDLCTDDNRSRNGTLLSAKLNS